MPMLPDNRQVNVTGPGKPPPPQIKPEARAEQVPPNTEKVPGFLTHERFFTACQALIQEKARFLQEKPSHKRTAEILTGMCGFQVSEASVPKMQKATKIQWRSMAAATPGGKGYERIRSLLRAVIADLRRGGFQESELPELTNLLRLWNEGSNSNG